jgi:tetratricopeptide (TPR) repeat protein
VALAPVVGLVPLGYADMADRYSYIPSAFLWLGVAVGWRHLRPFLPPANRRAVARFVAVGVCCYGALFAVISLFHMQAWQNIRALHSMAALHEPANVFSLAQLGDIQLEQGSFRDALRTSARLLDGKRSWMTEEAWRRTRAQGHYVRGYALFRLGRPTDALEAFEQVAPHLDRTVFHEPTNNSAVYAMMAEAYLDVGFRDEALACYEAICRRLPEDSFEHAFYSGVMAYHSGEYALGIAHLTRAGDLCPDRAEVRAQVQANLVRCRQALAQHLGRPAPE